MAEQGAKLNIHNTELMKNYEDLTRKRDEINALIKKQTAEKAAIQREIETLSSKLSKINESLSRKIAAKGEYDRMISEIEAMYTKLVGAAEVAVYTVREGMTKIDSSTPDS